MAIWVAQWTIDVEDVDAMSRFWAGALGYDIDKRPDGSAKLLPPDGAGDERPTAWLQPTVTPKRDKNRVHLDAVSDDGGADAEVERLIEPQVSSSESSP